MGSLMQRVGGSLYSHPRLSTGNLVDSEGFCALGHGSREPQAERPLTGWPSLCKPSGQGSPLLPSHLDNTVLPAGGQDLRESYPGGVL